MYIYENAMIFILGILYSNNVLKQRLLYDVILIDVTLIDIIFRSQNIKNNEE